MRDLTKSGSQTAISSYFLPVHDTKDNNPTIAQNVDLTDVSYIDVVDISAPAASQPIDIAKEEYNKKLKIAQRKHRKRRREEEQNSPEYGAGPRVPKKNRNLSGRRSETCSYVFGSEISNTIESVPTNTIESVPTIRSIPGEPMVEIVQLELSNKTNQTLAGTKTTFYDMVNNKIYEILIPDNELSKLTHVTLRNMDDLKQIPKETGCYWILTNEPINHCFNSGNHCPVVLSDGFSVVYNGVAAELRGRAKQHLLRQCSKGSFGSTSGISVDLLKETEVIKGGSKSHVKWMWQQANAAKKHKLPKILKCRGALGSDNQYYQIQRDTSKQEILDTLHLSQSEKEMAAKREELIFKNGIDVTDEKHAVYTWKFVFVPISDHGLRDCVERKWRIEYGVPILCTYKDGR